MKQLEFKTLDLKVKSQISKFTGQFEPYSDFNFISLYSWSVGSSVKYCIESGCLYLILPDYLTQKPLFTFLSARPEYCLDNYMKWLKSQSLPRRFNLLPSFMIEKIAQHLSQSGVSYKLVETQDEFDYIVNTHKISQAHGGQLRNLRHQLYQFNSSYGDRVHTAHVKASKFDDVQKVHELAKEWGKNKVKSGENPDSELQAIERLLAVAGEFDDLRFLKVMDDNRLIGMACYELLPEKYAIGHFLKYSPSYRGISYRIMHDLCTKLSQNGIDYLNIEQDLGLKNLRRSKLHFQPEFFLKKFNLELL